MTSTARACVRQWSTQVRFMLCNASTGHRCVSSMPCNGSAWQQYWWVSMFCAGLQSTAKWTFKLPTSEILQ